MLPTGDRYTGQLEAGVLSGRGRLEYKATGEVRHVSGCCSVLHCTVHILVQEVHTSYAGGVSGLIEQ